MPLVSADDRRRFMDLEFNCDTPFTKWITSAGLLGVPFVVVDVGVYNGESERWQTLGDHLVLHGFDPIEEEIERLCARPVVAGSRTYHFMAIGDEDGEQWF